MWMEYLKRICCFLLIAEVLLKLCPSAKYEGYLKMITGFICMVMILVPLASIFRGSEGEGLPELAAFERQVQEAMEEGRKQMQKELDERMEEGWKTDETFDQAIDTDIVE